MGKSPTRHYGPTKKGKTACGEKAHDVLVKSRDTREVNCYSCLRKLKQWAFNKRVRKLIRKELGDRGLL